MSGLFISGSGTNVGKTFVSCHIIRVLNQWFQVCARKPVESGCKTIDNKLIPQDAIMLNNACAKQEPIKDVCKFSFETIASAEMASKKQGANLTLYDLIKACSIPKTKDFVVVEGAGGLCSPIAHNSLNIDLAKALKLPLILVVEDELGAVNQALLSISAARAHNLDVKMIILNQITKNELNNDIAIRQYSNTDVVIFNLENTTKFNKTILALVR